MYRNELQSGTINILFYDQVDFAEDKYSGNKNNQIKVCRVCKVYTIFYYLEIRPIIQFIQCLFFRYPSCIIL